MGRPKHVRVMAGALEGDIFIGPKAEVRTPYTALVHVSQCAAVRGDVAAGQWFFGIM